MTSWCSENSSVYYGGKIVLLLLMLQLAGAKGPPKKGGTQDQAAQVQAAQAQAAQAQAAQAQAAQAQAAEDQAAQDQATQSDGAQAQGGESENKDLPKGATLPSTGGTGFTGSSRGGRIKIEHTPLPDWEVEQIKKLEFATYSPMDKEFQYINDQYYEAYQSKKFPRNRPWKKQRQWDDAYYETERCYDDYIKCILSAPFRTPVCALWRDMERFGYWQTNSYCDVFFENCRLRQRSWRVLDNGRCKFDNNEKMEEILITRRRILPNWKVFFKKVNNSRRKF